MQTRVISYIRVSTTDQAREGFSLDVQREKIEAYARAMDLNIVRTEIDAGVSAKDLDRPGIQRALKALEGGEVDGIVIAKLDRLTRSARDWGQLIDLYFRDGQRQLFSVSDSIDTRSAMGRFALGIMMQFAEFERELIAERTREVLAFKQSKGERVSRFIPYGWKLTGKGAELVPDRKEQWVIRLAKLHREHGASYRQISNVLAMYGYFARTGNRFNPGSIKNILNPKKKKRCDNNGRTNEIQTARGEDAPRPSQGIDRIHRSAPRAGKKAQPGGQAVQHVGCSA